MQQDDQDDAGQPPPKVRPFDFLLRRPLFIFALLFLAWVFFGQANMHLAPSHLQGTTHTTPAMPARTEIPAAEKPVEPAQEDTRIANLQHRLDKVEARLNALESAPAAASTVPVAGSAEDAKIDALQARLDALQQAHATEAGDATRVTEAMQKQEADIAALKTQLADAQTQALHRLALLAAFESVKDAVARGESFATPLMRMNDLAGSDVTIQPLLAQLTPYATNGIATIPLLQSRFEEAVPKALAPDASNAFTRHLESMIRIRKVGEQQKGNSDEAIIARAEAGLNRGDVKAALKETAALSAKADKVFSPWKKQAQAFLDVHDALAALQPALLQDKAGK